MKRVIIDAYKIALVTKRGKVVDILTEGKYWLRFGSKIEVHDVSKPFESNIDLAFLLENTQLRDMLKVVTITDQELGFEIKNGLYNKLLLPGRRAYWKSAVDYEVIKADLNELEVPNTILKKVSIKNITGSLVRVYNVEPYQKGLLYIDGTYQKTLEAGNYYYWLTEQTVQVNMVDLRLQSLEILGQEILTKDKVGIRVNFQVQYKVLDIEKALRDTKDFQKQLYLTLQIAMREYVGSMTLDQLLVNKEKIGAHIVTESKQEVSVLGVEVSSGGIKDIILPGEIKDIMNQVLVAQKKAQANTIMRQEETASTRSLLNTAKLMDDNAMLLKLKEMEYMEKIAEKIGEITVNGGTRVMDQLKQLVIAK